MKKLWQKFLDILFPLSCIGCAQENVYLCESCLEKIPKNSLYIEENIFALYAYQNPLIKKAVKDLKYRKQKCVTESFAKTFYIYVCEILEKRSKSNKESLEEIIVIPIPISKKRLCERGFNQAEKLARSLSVFKIETNILIKPKETKHQADIKNRNERLNNLKNSFSIINTEKIINKTILLIDDVTTTGATFTEARKVLLEAGAKEVLAVALAH